MKIENILKPIMVRSTNKLSFQSSDQVDIVTGAVLNNLVCINNFQPFPNRICSIRWVPRRPNCLLIGGKGGELCCVPDVTRLPLSENSDNENVDIISNGIGPGGEIREIIIDSKNNGQFYSLNVSGELVKVDLQSHEINVILPQGRFDIWYSGLAVHPDYRMIFMGDNKGYIHVMPDPTRAGKGVESKLRCHKIGKINHIEFHPRDPYLMATAATGDRCVKLWDIRMLKDWEELKTLEHVKPVNSAYFNHSGHKMITTDQGNELRVYSSGNWKLISTIEHPHRQFQHITPIRAEWHPLTDIIVAGKYPTNSATKKTVDFFDGRDGSSILSLNVPNQKICSLNRFNYTGDILASMCQSCILIWRQHGSRQDRSTATKSTYKRRKQSSSDNDSDNDDDDDDIDKQKKISKKHGTVKRTTRKKTSYVKKKVKGD